MTLAWKLAVKTDSNDPLEDDIIAFLMRQGFKAGRDTGSRGVVAVNGACHVHVMIVSNDGADRDMIRSLVTAEESLTFVHHGQVHQEQPALLPPSAELWTQALRKIRLTDHREFVLAVVGTRQCDANRLPWGQLQ